MLSLSSFDQSVVLQWNSFLSLHSTLSAFVRLIAMYGVYLIPVLWIIWWLATGKRQRLILLSSITAGVIAWQGLNRVLKLVYFHERPTQDLPVKEFLFARPDNSFPSDHTAFLAGIAFFFLLQRQTVHGLWLLTLAVVVSLARIAVAVHYPSDILVGFLSGMLIAWIVNLAHHMLSSTVWERALSIAHKLRLA